MNTSLFISIFFTFLCGQSINIPAAPESFTTERLIAHRITEQNLNDLHILLSNPLMQKGLRGTFSMESTKETLKDCLAHWEKHKFGVWVFYDKQSKRLIGLGELRSAREEVNQWSNGNIQVGEVMLSLVIAPEFWNKGFGKEIAKELTAVCFEQLNRESIVAITVLSNTASRKIMTNAGATCQEFPKADLALYRLTKKQYSLI